MANKFKESLQQMSDNTNPENQGILEDETSSVSLPTELQESDLLPETNSETNKNPETHKPSNSVTLEVGDVLDKLETKGRKGRQFSVYLSNEAIERLDEIAQEKNLSKSRIINAIITNALLGKSTQS